MVVGIFPDEADMTRLIGALLLEQNDEWTVQRSRYMPLESIARIGDGSARSPNRQDRLTEPPRVWMPTLMQAESLVG